MSWVAKCEENKIMAQLHSRKRCCPVAQLCALAPLHSSSPTGSCWRRLRPLGLKTMAEKRQLFVEMRAQNFDVIRLLTYTTVLSQNNSIVQKQCNLHLVDTWNMIESFETMVWIYWTIPLRWVWRALKRSSHPSTRRWTSACLQLTILILKGHWYIIIVHKYFPKRKKE